MLQQFGEESIQISHVARDVPWFHPPWPEAQRFPSFHASLLSNPQNAQICGCSLNCWYFPNTLQGKNNYWYFPLLQWEAFQNMSTRNIFLSRETLSILTAQTPGRSRGCRLRGDADWRQAGGKADPILGAFRKTQSPIDLRVEHHE